MDFFNKNFALIEESCKLIVEKLHGEQKGIQEKSNQQQEQDQDQDYEIAEEPQNQLERQKKKKKKPRKNLKNEEDEFLDNLVK